MKYLVTILLFATLQVQGQQLFHAHNKAAAAPAGPADPCGLSYTGGYETSAYNYFQSVEGGGDVLTSTEKTAISNYVVSMKSTGSPCFWSRDSANYLLAISNTATARKWNLKNPVDSDAAYRLTFNGTLTINANGVQGDGGSGYMDTHLPANAGGDNMHLSLYSTVNNTTGGKTDVGTEYVSLRLSHTGANSVMYDASTIGGTGRLFATSSGAAGYFFASRTSSAYFYVQQNGSTIGSSTGSPDHEAGVESFTLLAYHQAGGAVLQHSPRTLALVTIGGAYTESEAAQKATIVNTLMTALGINVY
jgi:hypothetical protein